METRDTEEMHKGVDMGIRCADMEENVNHCIQMTSNLIKSFHPLLGVRTEGVVELCKMTKDTGFFSNYDYRTLITSARLMNIGLISLPRGMLSMYNEDPESLSHEDMDMLRKHPEYAEELVSSFVGDLKDVGPTLRAVREHWDGSGYPDGKARENLPVAARYLAIAAYYVESDVSEVETIECIEALSGKLFHPESVRLFMKLMQGCDLPAKVKEILFSELTPGMVLAYPIHTPSGLLMFPVDTPIDEVSYAKIVRFNEMEPIVDRILVYRDHG